jgi:hypothetical protein
MVAETWRAALLIASSSKKGLGKMVCLLPVFLFLKAVVRFLFGPPCIEGEREEEATREENP